MNRLHQLHFKFQAQPFTNALFVVSGRLDTRTQFNDGRPQVTVQIDNVIIFFSLNFTDCGTQRFFEQQQFIQVGVVIVDIPESGLGQEVDLSIRELLFQATHYRGGIYNIAHGTEADNQYLHAIALSG